VRKFGLLVMVVAGVLAMGCGKKPCGDLAKQACELAPGTAACDRAGRLTANDECAGYLKDVKRYGELTTLTVPGPGVKPPAPPPPPPAPEAAATPPAAGPEAAPPPPPPATAPVPAPAN
jgi:hypothetical protein